MKLVVAGVGGRMGQTLVRLIHETAGVELSGAVEHGESHVLGKDIGELAGIGPLGISVGDDPSSAFAGADGVIDFTTPEASVRFAHLASQQGMTHIIGTTGCTLEDEAEFTTAAHHAIIVKSGNMSLGVNLLAALIEQATKALEPTDFDIEILEMHHGHKVDAPSGTALLLGEAAASGRGIRLKENMEKNRDGITGSRQTGSIGFAVMRGGGVIGEHSVLLAGKDEVIKFSHRAMDRTLFARGALKAALWGKGKPPGLYSMKDVLGFNT